MKTAKLFDNEKKYIKLKHPTWWEKVWLRIWGRPFTSVDLGKPGGDYTCKIFGYQCKNKECITNIKYSSPKDGGENKARTIGNVPHETKNA